MKVRFDTVEHTFSTAIDVSMLSDLWLIKKQKNKAITMHVPTLCDWFSTPASASDSSSIFFNLDRSTIWFSLDHKRNVSDGVIGGIGTLFSPDNTLYASENDSDYNSVPSENQP